MTDNRWSGNQGIEGSG